MEPVSTWESSKFHPFIENIENPESNAGILSILLILETLYKCMNVLPLLRILGTLWLGMMSYIIWALLIRNEHDTK
jgi:hypothetical protein